MVDNTIALQVQPPPASDLSTTLLRAYQIKNAQQQNELQPLRMQALQQQTALGSVQLQNAQQRQSALADYSMRKQSGDPRAVEALDSQPDAQAQVFANLDSAQKQRISRIMDAASSAWTARNDPVALKERVVANADALLKSGDIDQITHDTWVKYPDPTLALNELLVKGVGISKQFELENKIASQKTFETYDKLLSGVPGAPKYDPFQIRLFSGESNLKNVPTGVKNDAGRPASSAFGPGQMTTGLWNGVMKNYPHLGLRPEDRFVPEKQAIAEPYVRYEHINTLDKIGLPPTDKNLAMMWFLGGGSDGQSFLKGMAENPEQPATELVSKGAVESNRNVFFAPSGQPLPAHRVYSKITGGMPNDNVGVQTLAQSMARSGQGATVATDSLQAGVVSKLPIYERMMRDPRLPKEVQEAAREAFKIGMEYAKPTGDIKEYEYDKTHGGELLKRQVALKQAGANRISQINQGENSYDKAMGESFAKRYTSTIDAGDKAFATLGTIANMRKIMEDPNFQSGILTEKIRLPLAQAQAALGGDPKAAASMEQFRALANKSVLDALGGSLGNQISNADRDFIINTTMNLGTSPEGNKALLGIMEKIQRRNIDVARMAQEYVQRTDPATGKPHGRLDAGFDRIVSEWKEKTPLFSESERAEVKQIAESGLPKNGDVIDGWRYKGGNRADRANWERVQ